MHLPKPLARLGLFLTLAIALALEAFTGTPTSPFFFFGGTPPYLSVDPHGGIGATGIAFIGNTIYVADITDSNLYQFNATTGALNSQQLLAGCVQPVGLVAHPNGKLYIACFSTGIVGEVPFSGATTGSVVNTVAAIPGARDLTTSPTGELLVTSGASDVKRVTTGGTVFACASGGLLSDPDGIVVDRVQSPNVIYVSSNGSDTIVKIPISALGVCGTPSSFTTFTGGPGIDGIAIGLKGTPCQDKLYVNANDGTLYSVTVSSPGTHSVIATGSQRGDLVKVGPDNYLYATQQDYVSKIGPACFQTSDPAPCQLTGGLDISTGTGSVAAGSPDLKWVNGAGPSPAYVTAPYWLAPPSGTNWIHVDASAASSGQGLTSYVYSTSFFVPTAVASLTVDFHYAADNSVSFDLSPGPSAFAGVSGSLLTNFNTLHPPLNTIGSGPPISLASPASGTYTLTATVLNGSGTPSGLLVSGKVTCVPTVGGVSEQPDVSGLSATAASHSDGDRAPMYVFGIVAAALMLAGAVRWQLRRRKSS